MGWSTGAAASLRRACHAAVLVVPLLLLSGGVSMAAPDPRCGGSIEFPACANLRPGELSATIEDSGRTLHITDTVANTDKRTASDATTYRITLGDRVIVDEALAGIPVGGSSPVNVKVPIPADLRGAVQPVELVVDPDPPNTVPEFDESDNSADTRVLVAALPDLMIEQATLAASNGGSAIAAHIDVANLGGADYGGGTVVRLDSSGLSTTTSVPAIPAGGSTSVDTTIPVPESARVGNVAVGLTVDPDDTIAEAAETNNTFSPTPLRIAPELALDQPTHTVSGRSIRLSVTIHNTGSAGSPPTDVHASVEGSSDVRQVSAVPASGSTSLTFSLTAPPGPDGRVVDVEVSVDAVPGDSADGNLRHVQLGIHLAGAPDVAVSALRLEVVRGELQATGVVTNVGGSPAGPVHLVLAGSGTTREATVQTMPPKAARTVAFVLPIRAGDRGGQKAFTLRAAAVPGEIDLANNEARAAVRLPVHPPPQTHHHSSGVLVWAIVGGLLAGSLGVGVVVRGRRLSLHARWQTEERQGERPDMCQAPDSWVTRGECKLKPGWRRIEELEFSADGDDHLLKTVDGSVIEALNRAVRAHRVRRRRRVLALVTPLGEQLAAEIERWLADHGERYVAIAATIKGGKLECEFTRSECVRGGDACHWQEVAKWKGEVEHKATHEVTAIHVPFQPRPDRVEQLAAELVTLVGRVDVPRRLRSPEAASIGRLLSDPERMKARSAKDPRD